MSLDPTNTPSSAISRLQDCIDKVGKLKESGDLTVVDGKTQVVKKGFFGRLWAKIRGHEPDPVRNATALQNMQREITESISILRDYLDDPDKPQRNKDAMLEDLDAALSRHSPEALENYQQRMEEQLSKSAMSAQVDLDQVKQDFSSGTLDSIPSRFTGESREKMQRLVDFMHVAGPAARISSIPEVAQLMGSSKASEVSKLSILFEKAKDLVTSSELDVHAFEKIPSDSYSKDIAAAAASFLSEVETAQAQAGAVPPPPPMSTEQAQKLAAENEKQQAALRKAEAERRKQQEISTVKEQQKQLGEEIKAAEKDIQVMSSRTRGMLSKVKEMRTEISQLKKRYGSNKDFVQYETSLRNLEPTGAAKKEAKVKLDQFKAEMKTNANHLRDFVASSKSTISVPTLRSVQNPDTKEEELVEVDVTITRERAAQILKVEFEAPLRELEDSYESVSRSHESVEANIKSLKDKVIEGEPFSKAVVGYLGKMDAFNTLEDELRKANAEKFALQDKLQSMRQRENALEARLAKLEAREAVVIHAPKKEFDPTEVQRKLKSGGPVHLRDLNLKGRVKRQKPQVVDQENVDPQKKTRSVFGNLFRRRKDIS